MISAKVALIRDELEQRVLLSAVTDAPTLPELTVAMQHQLRDVYELGQRLGNRPGTFIKLGDSHSSNEFGSLKDLGRAGYHPALFGLAGQPELIDVWAKYLQPISGGNSFSRNSTAAIPGGTSTLGVSRFQAEFAAVRPTVAFLQFGHNDMAYRVPGEQFAANLRLMIGWLKANGTIPVLVTSNKVALGALEIVDPQVIQINQIQLDVAAEAQIPLLNLMPAIEPLPIRGLDSTLVHLNQSPFGGGDFSPSGLQFGDNVRNLAILEMLNWIERFVVQSPKISSGRVDGAATSSLSLQPGQSVVALGSDSGEPPLVTLHDSATQQPIASLQPYAVSVQGGVNVALGDVNGDGVDDLVTVPASNAAAHVRIFSGRDGADLGGFLAFDASFTGGATLALADLDGDGRDEIIIGAGAGGGPVVKVVDAATGQTRATRFVFESTFGGGVQVSAGDADGDGRDEVFAMPIRKGGPVLVVLESATLTERSRGFVADANLRIAWNLATGDTDADGRVEAIISPGIGGGPVVSVVDVGTFQVRTQWFADDPVARNGVRVAFRAASEHTGGGYAADTRGEYVVVSQVTTQTTLRRFRADASGGPGELLEARAVRLSPHFGAMPIAVS